jgi:hypothetical protein
MIDKQSKGGQGAHAILTYQLGSGWSVKSNEPPGLSTWAQHFDHSAAECRTGKSMDAFQRLCGGYFDVWPVDGISAV